MDLSAECYHPKGQGARQVRLAFCSDNGKEVSDPIALGFVLEEMGQHENGIQWLKKTLEIDTANAKENAPDAAMSHPSLGIVHVRKGEYSAVLKSFADEHLATATRNMDLACKDQDDLPQAIAYLKESA